MGRPAHHLAYVFERFPSFTQTFCAREVAELRRAGVRPLVFSIRDTSGEVCPCPVADEVAELVHLLPQGKELVDEVKRLKREDQLPQRVVLTLRHWGDRPDKQRVYEAAYIGHRLAGTGVRHVHSHFAGVAARTCWWIRFFYGITFSFTGHANDLFCQQEAVSVDLEALMADAAAVVTVSDFTARWLHERFPGSASKTLRVYNGLDLTPFAAIARQRFAGEGGPTERDGAAEPLVVSVGRLIEKKGYPDLIDACAILRDRGVPFRCKVVGDGPLEEALRERVRRLGLGDVVELTGPCSVSGVRDLLGDANVFALACTTEADGGMDNLPTVIMEAMAAGLPCVSTKLAGVPEMVVDGSTGLLTEPDDPPAFAEALARLLGDPGLRTTMGRAGLELALERFDQTKTAAQLYTILLSRGRLPFDRELARLHPEHRLAFGAQLGRRALAALGRARFHPGGTVPPEARG